MLPFTHAVHTYMSSWKRDQQGFSVVLCLIYWHCYKPVIKSSSDRLQMYSCVRTLNHCLSCHNSSLLEFKYIDVQIK